MFFAEPKLCVSGRAQETVNQNISSIGKVSRLESITGLVRNCFYRQAYLQGFTSMKTSTINLLRNKNSISSCTACVCGQLLIAQGKTDMLKKKKSIFHTFLLKTKTLGSANFPWISIKATFILTSFQQRRYGDRMFASSSNDMASLF